MCEDSVEDIASKIIEGAAIKEMLSVTISKMASPITDGYMVVITANLPEPYMERNKPSVFVEDLTMVIAEHFADEDDDDV